MKFEQIHSVQSWLPFEKILDNGIIKLKEPHIMCEALLLSML